MPPKSKKLVESVQPAKPVAPSVEVKVPAKKAPTKKELIEMVQNLTERLERIEGVLGQDYEMKYYHRDSRGRSIIERIEGVEQERQYNPYN